MRKSERTAVIVSISLICAGVALSILLASGAIARDGGQWAQNDPDVREWYRDLKQPDYPNASCCGEADAYWADGIEVKDGRVYAIITDTRDDGPLKRYHVEIGTRVYVPDHKIRWDKGNPTGHAVVFLNYAHDVICFVQDGGV